MHYFRGISLLGLPGKVYGKCLEKRCREIIEPKLDDTQCGFRPESIALQTKLTPQKIFEKFYECAKDVYKCFVGLEKTFDRVLHEKLWRVVAGV